MFEIKVTIEATELVHALNNIAAAMSGVVPAPAAPVAPIAPTNPSPAPPTNTVQYPAQGIPLAPPPTYTREQIMYAGSTLADAGKMQDLINLLHTFGVQAVTELKQEQLGAFATAMRELGAKI